ncbi:multicopper oxidase domain-containing protein, partial [Rhizobium leguminosarum]|uniref:multicopper oxidase domain-containing protein n=1 Tax=Rhizobium leguminosarum TaxID=384 RepID=UPI003F953EA1
YLIQPDEKVQLAFVADNPGDWLLHFHIIDALGQRIDENFRRRACHLDQAELRPEGRFTQELGVDGDEVGLGQLFAGGRQI